MNFNIQRDIVSISLASLLGVFTGNVAELVEDMSRRYWMPAHDDILGQLANAVIQGTIAYGFIGLISNKMSVYYADNYNQLIPFAVFYGYTLANDNFAVRLNTVGLYIRNLLRQAQRAIEGNTKTIKTPIENDVEPNNTKSCETGNCDSK